VKELENLKRLEVLGLNGTNLTSTRGLEKLTQLKELGLYNNKLTSVEGLEKLTKLPRLNLDNNQLTSVKGLKMCTQLKELSLQNNPDLTKAQIAGLRKALPNCNILSNIPLTKEESAKVIEAAIRRAAKKPTGELTKADFEKVTKLSLYGKQLTDVKGLEKLTQLKTLSLTKNPNLTKAQVAELKKALPKCLIFSNPKK